MDNIDDLIAKLSPEQQIELIKNFKKLGEELEHSKDVQDLKDVLKARAEALEILNQIKNEEH